MSFSKSNPDLQQEELLLRLQSQFGDMDLTQLLENDNGEQKDGTDDASEESSLAEPTAEELKAWQEAQFQKGQKALERKRQETNPGCAIQRRRAQLAGKVKTSEDLDEDWEQVAALPDLKDQASAFFPSMDRHGNEILGVHPLLQKLTVDGPDPEILGTSWERLYSSAEGDGLSFMNLMETLRFYTGPTVMLIGAIPSTSKVASDNRHKKEQAVSQQSNFVAGSTTLGFYTASPWVESTSFTGTSDCFLFAFNETGEIQFFRPKPPKKEKESTTHYIYCHPTNMTAASRARRATSKVTGRTDGLVHGLGVGGTPLQPRLHLTESLEDCRAMDYCTLFEAGDLLMGHGKESLNYFDVDCLEVWGVGGEEWIAESLMARQASREVLHANLMKARQVKDKQAFVRDLKRGTLLGGRPTGLFAHNEHGSLRCDV